MSGRTTPATVGKLREYTIIGFALVFLLLTALNVLQIDKDRVRCETANNARISELHQRENLVTVNVGRVISASSQPERKSNLEALAIYRSNLLELIDTQREVAVNPDVWVPGIPELLQTLNATEPLDVDESSVAADCSVTNPYPPPINWFA